MASSLSPDGALAWIPHTRSNVGNEALLFDTTVFPVVSALDLETQAQRNSARLHLDISDKPVAYLSTRWSLRVKSSSY